jgi:hypothetical protein
LPGDKNGLGTSRLAQVVERLPNKCEALSSNPTHYCQKQTNKNSGWEEAQRQELECCSRKNLNGICEPQDGHSVSTEECQPKGWIPGKGGVVKQHTKAGLMQG